MADVSDKPSPAARLTAWLDALDGAARDRLAKDYAAATVAGGAVVRKLDGSTTPIPPLLSPEGIATARRAELAGDARALVSALGRLTAWLKHEDRARDRHRLFRAFTPLERVGLERWHAGSGLATARVDFFLDERGAARALEVNATIPAMQGYTDIVAESFLRTVGRARGLDDATIARLVDANGRNTDDLFDSLMAHYRRMVEAAGGGDARPATLAIVARDNDAQQGELEHYVRRFSSRGPATWLTPHEAVALDGGRLTVAGRAPDLVYRHVFARRLDESAPFARALHDADRHRIRNPVASHLEVKAMLGYLSRAGAGDSDGDRLAESLGLDDAERIASGRALPWTRILAPGPSRGPAGEAIADLARTVAAEPERFVVKRSWDYGGKSVFLGLQHDDAAAARAAECLERAAPMSWPDLVAAASTDEHDAWVVQEFVRTTPRRHLVASSTGATWKELYVDLSFYSSSGVEVVPQGGASRASASRIVNILGGGGLAPLVRDEVLEELLAATASSR